MPLEKTAVYCCLLLFIASFCNSSACIGKAKECLSKLVDFQKKNRFYK